PPGKAAAAGRHDPAAPGDRRQPEPGEPAGPAAVADAVGRGGAGVRPGLADPAGGPAAVVGEGVAVGEKLWTTCRDRSLECGAFNAAFPFGLLRSTGQRRGQGG